MDIVDLKKLSGIHCPPPAEPSMGSNISMTGTEKKRIERERNIQPGTPEWFRLWFSLPYLTGERPI